MSGNGNLRDSSSSVRKLKITFLKADSLPYEGTFLLFVYLNSKSYCFCCSNGTSFSIIIMFGFLIYLLGTSF